MEPGPMSAAPMSTDPMLPGPMLPDLTSQVPSKGMSQVQTKPIVGTIMEMPGAITIVGTWEI